jgi:serine/threonine protein kinase
LKNVEIVRPIGKGAFGEAYLGKWRRQDVALKQVEDDGSGSLESEIATLLKFNHPKIVRFFGLVKLDTGSPAMCMEFCTNGSLVTRYE